jgi:hypothetical protein
MTQLKLFDIPQTVSTSDDYWTPKWIFDALGLHFDLDVACPPEGPTHTPCTAYYTQSDDGLIQKWHGLVFMNPPYSKATPWVDKWIAHANGIALLPCAKSKWYGRLWESPAQCTTLERQTGLMKFDTPTKNNGSIFIASALWAIGEQAVAALHNSGIGKVR